MRDYVDNRRGNSKKCCNRCGNRYIILTSLQTQQFVKAAKAVSGSYPYGAIAQLGERLHGMQEVSGSIPLSSTKDSGGVKKDASQARKSLLEWRTFQRKTENAL